MLIKGTPDIPVNFCCNVYRYGQFDIIWPIQFIQGHTVWHKDLYESTNLTF